MFTTLEFNQDLGKEDNSLECSGIVYLYLNILCGLKDLLPVLQVLLHAFYIFCFIAIYAK